MNNFRVMVRLSSALAAVLLLLGCRTTAPHAAADLQKFEFVRGAMGTQFRITLYARDATTARGAADAAFDRVDQLEEILSDYQADSELSLLREQPVGVPVKVSADLFRVLLRAQDISRATDGVFDVTTGPFTRLWRFSRKRGVLPSEQELAEARKAVGYEKLALDPAHSTITMRVPGMRLDVGGIAKGYAADEALKKLRDLGFGSALVAASGDIAIGNPPPGKKGWTVAIQPPRGTTAANSPTNLPGTLTLRNAAVSTSGHTEQFIVINGVRYSHILDPRTGLGLTNAIQATVIAPTASLSDPLATSVCILGPKKGMRMLKGFPGAKAFIAP